MSDEDKTPPAGGDKTFTQADVDRIVAERLKREREAGAAKVQQLEDRVTVAEKQKSETDLKLTKFEVAIAKGLTPAQAKRLSGTTKEELESDADDLLEAFGGRKKDDPKPSDKEEPKDGGKKNDDGQDDGDDAGQPVFGRPKERLVSGAAPDREPEKSSEELADEVWKKARGG